MKKLFVVIICFQFGLLFSQEENKEQIINQVNRFIATGNDVLVKEGNFPEAEGEYRKAIAKDPVNPVAKYNLANAYYNSEKYDEATLRYTEAAKVATSKPEKHKAFHNQGNTFMEQKKYKEAIEAYKNALRNNPKDNQTRYNLALAKKMLEKQEQENEKNKDKDQNKDKNQDDKDKKEGEDDNKDKKGDEGDKDKDKKDKEDDQKDKGDKGDEGEDKKDKEKEDKGDPKDEENNKGKDPKDKEEGQPKEQQPQQVQGQLSPERVKSLLEAMNNQEKKVQDKINAKKAQGSKTKSDKDW